MELKRRRHQGSCHHASPSTVSVHEPFAYLERARVADALGRAVEAREYYERFLWLYDSPGASHRHLLEEARSSLVRLR